MRTVETLTRLTKFLQGSYQSRAVDGTTGLTARVLPRGCDNAIARVEAVLIRSKYVELGKATLNIYVEHNLER